MKKILILLPILLLIIVASSVFYFYINLQGTCQKNCQVQVFVVPQGASINEVLTKLEKEKIIRNAFAAKIYLKLKNWSGKIQAGDFRLNPKDNLERTVASLQKGTLDFWVTIPEGYRAEQVYERIKDSESGAKNRDVEVFKQNEGYLFPDTYLIPKSASDENIVTIMKNNFNSRVSGLLKVEMASPSAVVALGNGDKISINNLIILSSLVEREAKNDSERPIIANIIYKRWKADWPLQIDATIQYIVGKSKEWWKKELSLDDLKVDSPYNTYLNKGLPPGAIASPGIKAITAVINQAQTDYWFYATGKDGITRYSTTLNQHNQNIEKNLNN